LSAPAYAAVPGSTTHAVEARTMPAAPSLAGCLTEKLRRSAAPFTAPFLRGLHQPRRLQRAPEARLVQAPLEQQLVSLLELAQREGGRQQLKGNRLVIEPRTQGAHRSVDHGALSRRDRRQRIQREPAGLTVRRGQPVLHARRNQRDIGNRDVRSGRMTPSVAEGRDLLEHTRRATER